ncbi:selenophosphate synthase [Alteribacillus persepolensis]|uniref:Selenide, water dikinase n=1 Tax=Alteribacillus persepolensis TaxID=568899 RepID=A0A1G7YY67_9BACI|nr:selenophosphate synthase [Alteribacillus persepolensis]
MRHLPERETNPNLLVGMDTSDDGGVYKLTDDIALVQSVDYFTPVVDDPYMFGQIAAANALSDIYAMGGKPTTVLNIVGFPIKELPDYLLAGMMKGAADKVEESGATIVGGHSIDDQEPKFGLAATGIVHPEKVWANKGAEPGDVLVLTKPLGVGILTTAIKRQKATAAQEEAVTKTMAKLNKAAAETLMDYQPHAVTDVTGFGLIGHSFEMAEASNVTFTFDTASIPLLDGARSLAEQGIVPGGSKSNENYLSDHIRRADHVSSLTQTILCDAITSGGLLAAMPEDEAKQYVEAMHKQNEADTSIIGYVEKRGSHAISLQ